MGRADGRNGEITVDVTFSEDAITDIVVKDHQETAGIADAAINDLPGEIVANQSLAVDAKSGATFTSEGIVNARGGRCGAGGRQRGRAARGSG